MKPLHLLALLTLFLSVVCNAEDLGKDFSQLQNIYNRGMSGFFFEKNQEIGYTGKVYQKYPDGQFKMKGQLKKGKLHGLWVMWHENGHKWSEGKFMDGEPVGLSVSWYENGQKSWETNYKDGKEDGLSVGWHKNGQKRVETTYKYGNLVEGFRKYWNSKGEPVDSVEEARN